MAKDFLYPLRRLHGTLYEYRRLRKLYITPFKNKKRQKGKCVFLVMTPDHTNLGDHAIASAAIQLLKKANVEYVEITFNKLLELRAIGLLSLLNKCPILINGGGNLGTLWFNVEQLMRDIVKANPKSPIMILPNTVYYENSDWGNKEFARAKQIYNSHRNLSIYARERFSYDILCKNFNHVKLVPDLVMALDECEVQLNRKGCLVCLRKDCEKTISDADEAKLINKLKSIFGDNITYSDTHANQNLSETERPDALEQKYNEFRSAELVVTDRLHGMIFCAITGTPCIVVNSKSPKVKGCYEWIKHLDYVKFVESIDEIIDKYNEVPKKAHHYDNSHLTSYYQSLAEDIQNIWR